MTDDGEHRQGLQPGGVGSPASKQVLQALGLLAADIIMNTADP